jgi:hypothetical protein
VTRTYTTPGNVVLAPQSNHVACTGKRCYDAPSAKRVAKTLRRHDDKSQAHPYHCPHCHNWHIGQVTKRRAERRRPRVEDDASC